MLRRHLREGIEKIVGGEDRRRVGRGRGPSPLRERGRDSRRVALRERKDALPNTPMDLMRRYHWSDIQGIVRRAAKEWEWRPGELKSWGGLTFDGPDGQRIVAPIGPVFVSFQFENKYPDALSHLPSADAMVAADLDNVPIGAGERGEHGYIAVTYFIDKKGEWYWPDEVKSR